MESFGDLEQINSIYIISTEKNDLVFEQISSWTALWDELSSRTKVPLYLLLRYSEGGRSCVVLQQLMWRESYFEEDGDNCPSQGVSLEMLVSRYWIFGPW